MVNWENLLTFTGCGRLGHRLIFGEGPPIRPTTAMSVIVTCTINIAGVTQGHLSSRENRDLSEVARQAGGEARTGTQFSPGTGLLPSQHVASRAGNPWQEQSGDLMVTGQGGLGPGRPRQSPQVNEMTGREKVTLLRRAQTVHQAL